MAESTHDGPIIFYLRDRNQKLVDAWKDAFKRHRDHVKLSSGDIFKDAPAVDAIVSPANSFGFMDGGIDMVYSLHFGWQLQARLQKIIKLDHDGELLVGDAIILKTHTEAPKAELRAKWAGCNQDQPIQYLISAPTMRVPCKIPDTTNTYLAMRAVILAVQKHNAQSDSDPIRSVLCPGLGTAVGGMPFIKAANQMLRAYEIYQLGLHSDLRDPEELAVVWKEHQDMVKERHKYIAPEMQKKQTKKQPPKTLNPEQALVKALHVKSGVVKRLAKDMQMYKKEIEEQQCRIDKMVANAADEHDIRKQREVLEESSMMIPNCRQRLLVAWDELDGLLQQATDLTETDEYKKARDILAETKTLVKE